MVLEQQGHPTPPVWSRLQVTSPLPTLPTGHLAKPKFKGMEIQSSQHLKDGDSRDSVSTRVPRADLGWSTWELRALRTGSGDAPQGGPPDPTTLTRRARPSQSVQVGTGLCISGHCLLCCPHTRVPHDCICTPSSNSSQEDSAARCPVKSRGRMTVQGTSTPPCWSST